MSQVETALKHDPKLWDRLRHIAGILLLNGYDSVGCYPHPTRDSILFSVHMDDNTHRGAVIRTWRLNQMNDLKVIEEVGNQITDKWKRV